MRKMFWGIIPLIALFIGCGSAQVASPGGMTLDQAIADAAARIDGRIAAGSKIALLNFSSPSDRFSLYVLDELSANLLDSGKLTVVDRREIDLIRTEIEFQYSGEVADDSMQAVGRRLGAQSIVSGSLMEIGRNMYRVTFRVLNVESAAVEVQHRANIVADTLVLALLEGGRTAVAASPPRVAPAAQAPVVQAPAAQAPASQAVVALPTPAVAPVVVVPEPRLENGRRTFYPRPQAYQGALMADVFVEYIAVRNGYMTIRLRSRPTGVWGNSSFRSFRDLSRVLLRDLDRPDRSFVPVQGGWNQPTSGVQSLGGVWISFLNVNATRFSLVCTASAPRIVFEEIRIGDPD